MNKKGLKDFKSILKPCPTKPKILACGETGAGVLKKPDRYKHGLFFLGAHSKTGTEEGNVFGTLGE